MSRENLLFRPSSLEIKVFSTRQYHMYELTRYKHTLIHTHREVHEIIHTNVDLNCTSIIKNSSLKHSVS
jgi:hypothetical protein